MTDTTRTMSNTPTKQTTDTWNGARDLADQAVSALPQDFGGALILASGWLLCSPGYVSSIDDSLVEGRKAKDALHFILGTAREGLGI